MWPVVACGSDVVDSKVALITGVTGQDGSYLAELLLSKNYKVYGITRSAVPNISRIAHLLPSSEQPFQSSRHIELWRIDWKNRQHVEEVLKSTQPDEVYHLAGSSDVKRSYWLAEDSLNSIYLNTLRMLDAILNCAQNDVRFFHPSSAEMFGSTLTEVINEDTPFRPCSPYAISKACAHWTVATYRETHEMFACNGIMFNHESPRRDKSFVTRKISEAVAKIFLDKQQLLELGNLDAVKDWGHSRDYTTAMWHMLQQPDPDDYVVATGECHSVREFVEEAFRVVDIDIRWEGKGLFEVGKDKRTDKVRVKIDPKYFRPSEDDGRLSGSKKESFNAKSKRSFGWKPKIKLKELVEEMVQNDIQQQLDTIEVPEL